MPKTNYLTGLILVTSLFFLWAFLHNINPILIPHLKKACELSDTQSSFIDVVVYLGYFCVAIPAGLYMHKNGYKSGIICGLALYAAGALLFIPAADARSYAFFLFALFVSASGATFLETVANPYITILGDRKTSEQRLNFAQSFNGVGAFLAPILGGRFILSGIEHSESELKQMSPAALQAYMQSEANTVKMPYLVIGVVVIILLLLFVFTKLPDVKEDDSAVDSHAPGTNFSTRVFRHPHFKWAVVAQFFYLGAQVGVGSFFIRYARFVADMDEKSAAWLYGSIAMVGFMIGRFVGTALMRAISAAKLLAIFSGLAAVMVLAGVLLSGDIALYAIMSVPFFMSIMFPTIFALGIKGLGEETKIASSFLVMSIIGGGFAPLIMGLVSDMTHSIQIAYVIPLICFLVVFFYGTRGHRVIHETD
ncbi:MAG: L-fucose:H+ symporter permease [Mucilaginibacter polytrichastri]|nr:L-fucose:H+ symporter permease [Mucilaginibacter polytrichastri]